MRAAKGHDLDPSALNYKSGDQFLASARGRSNQNALFFDSTGRSYSLPINTLPSARTQGEPLSNRLSPPAGAEFISLFLGNPEDKILLGSSSGYGFIATLEEITSRNRTGKSVVTIPPGARALPPLLFSDPNLMLALLTNTGSLLIISVAELPRLPRGKGIKLISLATAKDDDTANECVINWALFGNQDNLELHCDPILILTPKDWKNYLGSRARRGFQLPRGCQQIKSLTVPKIALPGLL